MLVFVACWPLLPGWRQLIPGDFGAGDFPTVLRVILQPWRCFCCRNWPSFGQRTTLLASAGPGRSARPLRRPVVRPACREAANSAATLEKALGRRLSPIASRGTPTGFG